MKEYLQVEKEKGKKKDVNERHGEKGALSQENRNKDMVKSSLGNQKINTHDYCRLKEKNITQEL